MVFGYPNGSVSVLVVKICPAITTTVAPQVHNANSCRYLNGSALVSLELNSRPILSFHF